jgi:hypothetical protein
VWWEPLLCELRAYRAPLDTPGCDASSISRELQLYIHVMVVSYTDDIFCVPHIAVRSPLAPRSRDGLSLVVVIIEAGGHLCHTLGRA